MYTMISLVCYIHKILPNSSRSISRAYIAQYQYQRQGHCIIYFFFMVSVFFFLYLYIYFIYVYGKWNSNQYFQYIQFLYTHMLIGIYAYTTEEYTHTTQYTVYYLYFEREYIIHLFILHIS